MGVALLAGIAVPAMIIGEWRHAVRGWPEGWRGESSEAAHHEYVDATGRMELGMEDGES